MDFQRECGQLLDNFETIFRGFVRDKLSELHGNHWWELSVPEHIRSECQKRQTREQARRFPRIKRPTDPIDFTHLGELKDIVVKSEHFETAFKPYFTNQANIATRVEELIGYRNPAAHNRPIFGLEEYQTITVTCRNILEAMEVDVPPEFQPIERQPETDGDDDEFEPLVTLEDFGPRPRCFDNLPRPDYSDFFGRTDETQQILDSIAHPRAWITVIDGIGGVGKTALALNCAEQIKARAVREENDFEYVIWASAKTERLVPTGITQLQPGFTDLRSLTRTILETTGFGDYEPDNPDELVKEILSISRTLLVLDNLETVTEPDVFEFLLEIPAPSKVLATTRTRLEGSQKNLRLTALPTPDALELIRQLADDLDVPELEEVEDATLVSLIQRVGGIPLAIKLAVGRIATGMPLASYLDKLDSGAAQYDLLEFCFAESWADLNQDARKVLLAIILFGEQPSEVELRRVIGIPEMRLSEAIGTLTRRAFLNRSFHRERQTNLYSLLPLTEDFIRQESEQYPDIKAQLQDSYNAYLVEMGRFQEAIGQITHLLPHSASASEEEKLSNMLVDSAWRTYQAGDYREAVARLETATSYRDTAYLNHTWGVIERDEGRFGTAREKFRKAILIDPARLRTWRSWGSMENRLSNLDNTLHCFSNATQLPESNGQDFHVLGVCLSKLARDQYGADREETLTRAETALRRGFSDNPFGYRDTHHNVVNCHSLALTLDRLGRADEAMQQCENGLEIEPANDRLISLSRSLARKLGG